ncbi:MAG: glycosyl transferase family 1, partial [Deltaproteobacteria bacterium]|nr:glycosyl transferase family 1 [Deltaproteobacteria bacterium]
MRFTCATFTWSGRSWGGGRRIVTNSWLCKEHAQRYYGVPAERIEVVYNGVNHQVFNPQAMAAQRLAVRRALGVGEEALAILHVSNNWKRKG